MKRLVLPPLRSYQTELVRDTTRDLFCVSATQVGKTFAYACKVLAWLWCYRGIHPWWWVAPSYKQSEPGQRILYELAASSSVMKSGPKPPFRTVPPPPLQLINGKTLEFRTWDDPTNLMGTSIAGGVVDEAGVLTPTAHSAISTRRSETLGPLWYIGNPGMVSGPFRRLCAQAESGAEHMAFHRWTWLSKYNALLETNPIGAHDYRAFINQERDSLPEYEFRRLYEAEWTEDEAAVFRNVWTCSEGEPFDPYQRPDGLEGPWVIGLDVAQQVDYLCAVGLNTASYRAEFMDRFRGLGYPQAAQRLKQIQDTWQAPIVLEINGPGIAMSQEFDRLGVTYIPFTTTSQSKQEAVLNLASDMQNQRIALAEMEPLQYELSAFRYHRLPSGNYRYEAPTGEHDDCVMALVLACWGKSRAIHDLSEYGWIA